jgi:hypothetical protein
MVSQPSRIILRDDPYHDPSEDTMQFRLTYEGPLLSNGHSRHKHEIRKHFHIQLKKLWEVTNSLKEMRNPVLDLIEVNRGQDRSRIEWLAERFDRLNHNFVPLVTDDLEVSFCGLNILYLRPGPPGGVRADIDNRMKTLFDALRMPSGKEELGEYNFPTEDEKPFYCLLQDDKFITQLSVETDTLLEPIGTLWDENDARLIIGVNLQPRVYRLDLRFRSMNFV